jgi:DNA-binding transcriptional regulator YhcF (GntR family)
MGGTTMRSPDPVVRIDGDSPTPPYEQLRSQLAQQISDRVLVVGTRLPTVRQMAADLELAVNTVARAYRELEEAGLIETRGRAGSFVSAAGQTSRIRAQAAARTYADTVHRLGLPPQEALDIVRAALDGAVSASRPPAR